MEKEINEFGEFREESNFIQKNLFTLDGLDNADCSRVEIPVGVKVIGRNAFDYKTKIEEIIIPNTVTTIEDYAFAWCKSLKSIIIPNSVTRIGAYAFSNCGNLESVVLSENIDEIPEYCFYSCPKLREINIPKKVRIINKSAFRDCDELEEVSISNTVKMIYSCAFNGTKFGKNVGIFKVWFDKTAFFTDNTFSTLMVSKDITEASIDGLNAKFKNVIFMDGLEKVPKNAFEYCASIENVEFCNSINYIGVEAFNYCTSLKNIALPENLKIIDKKAFKRCENLETVKLPENLEQIKTEAFAYCINLSNLQIPQTLWKIEENAFAGCDKLVSLELDSEYFDSNKVFGIDENQGGGEEKKSLEELATVVEGDESGVVRETAGYQCNKQIVNIVLKEGVKEIEGLAFMLCSNLMQVTLPKSLKKVGYGVFNECKLLNKVIYNGSIADWCKIDFTRSNIPFIASHTDEIGISNPIFLAKSLFIDGKLVEDLVIPKEVEKIGDYAFVNGKFKSITIENGVESLGKYGFYHCNQVEEIVIPDSVKNIDSYCFKGCENLKRIIIGSGLRSKGFMLFGDCEKLEAIYVKSTKKEVDDNWMVNYSQEESSFNVFYYSETKPTENGKFWHLVAGEIVKW